LFITLLAVTFFIALIVTFIVARVFQHSIAAILERIFGDQISAAWQRYIMFAIYVVGISGGVRIWELEKYISPRGFGEPQLILNRDRWVLEVYRTIIETLQSTAWLLLVFFLVALIAYGIVRLVSKASTSRSQPTASGPAAEQTLAADSPKS
jgi:hypothetical protein